MTDLAPYEAILAERGLTLADLIPPVRHFVESGEWTPADLRDVLPLTVEEREQFEHEHERDMAEVRALVAARRRPLLVRLLRRLIFR